MPGNSLVAEAMVTAAPEEVFAYLARLENHWALAGRWIRVVRLHDSARDGGEADGGVVRVRGPLGIGRTARTRVLEARPPGSIAGLAEIGAGTRARVSWTLEPVGEDTRVRLEAVVERASALDRALLALGGAAWMRRSFRSALARLAARYARPAAPAKAPPVGPGARRRRPLAADARSAGSRRGRRYG